MNRQTGIRKATNVIRELRLTASATRPGWHQDQHLVPGWHGCSAIYSLRVGHDTSAARADIPLDRIATRTRHRDITVLVTHYIRPVEALATTSSRKDIAEQREVGVVITLAGARS